MTNVSNVKCRDAMLLYMVDVYIYISSVKLCTYIGITSQRLLSLCQKPLLSFHYAGQHPFLADKVQGDDDSEVCQ